MTKTPIFAVGDKVAYSVQFLKSTGQSHSNLARARGIITELKPFGDNVLATIDWKDPEIPDKVITFNLAKVGLNTRFSAC